MSLQRDPHFTDERAAAGAAIDAAFRDGIARLGAARDAQDVKLAKQVFEKAGVQRFLYLATLQALSEPSRASFDRAYGYFGSGPANEESARRGLALLAAKRDGNNGTTLASELFVQLLDGRCALDAALQAAGVDALPIDADPAYAGVVGALDGKLQLVFAYSIGHELFDVLREAADPAAAAVKLYEGEGFFRTLEPYLVEAGGAEAAFAAEFRAALDAAIASNEAGDVDWITTFDAAGFLAELEALFGIDVKA